MRTIGPFDGGYSLWWAVEGRNKKSITLDLRPARGRRHGRASLKNPESDIEG